MCLKPIVLVTDVKSRQPWIKAASAIPGDDQIVMKGRSLGILLMSEPGSQTNVFLHLHLRRNSKLKSRYAKNGTR